MRRGPNVVWLNKFKMVRHTPPHLLRTDSTTLSTDGTCLMVIELGVAEVDRLGSCCSRFESNSL